MRSFRLAAAAINGFQLGPTGWRESQQFINAFGEVTGTVDATELLTTSIGGVFAVV